MDNWDDLRFVVALARYGSMSLAARHLRTNTATVSRRIRRINETNTTPLFQRGQNDWELTPTGQQIFKLASRFSDDLMAFASVRADGETAHRKIRVTALEFLVSEILAPALPGFMSESHNISLELNATEQKQSLAFGEADIALRLFRPTEGRLVARCICRIPMGFWGRAASQDWIGLPGNLDWTSEMRAGHALFGRPPKLRLSSFNAILEGVERLPLAGVAPRFMAQRRTGLQLFPQPQEEVEPKELWMIFHERSKNDLQVREVCRWIEASVSNLE